MEDLDKYNILSTKKHFDPIPDETDGKVKGTPFIKDLYLKKGARFTLNYNVDVVDGLNNGAKGVVLDFYRTDDRVTHVICQFDNPKSGQALREQYAGKIDLSNYENGTPISRLSFSYNLGGKQGHKAICMQFPQMLAFAVTIHRIQGATIPPPKTITTDFSKIFDAAQAYVVLGRLRSLDQLFLLNDVYRHKIYASPKALSALKTLESKAINRNSIGRREDQIKIVCLNIQNMIHHFEDLKHHHKILEHNLIFLSETWLSNVSTCNTSHPYQLDNYSSHFVNIGNGKGLAAYYEPIFKYENQVSESSYQLLKYSACFLHRSGKNVEINVISIYRSSASMLDRDLITKLHELISKDKICVICGDFNIRYASTPTHNIVSELLSMNFTQLIDHPTHMDGGIIDHLYLYKPSIYEDVKIEWSLFAPFYSDHYGISIIINKNDGEFLEMPSSVPDTIEDNAENRCNTSKASSSRGQISTNKRKSLGSSERGKHVKRKQ